MAVFTAIATAFTAVAASGIAAGVVSTAIVGATTGAVIGAATALITGENILEGAVKGAIVGGISGAVLGGIGSMMGAEAGIAGAGGVPTAEGAELAFAYEGAAADAAAAGVTDIGATAMSNYDTAMAGLSTAPPPPLRPETGLLDKAPDVAKTAGERIGDFAKTDAGGRIIGGMVEGGMTSVGNVLAAQKEAAALAAQAQAERDARAVTGLSDLRLANLRAVPGDPSASIAPLRTSVRNLSIDPLAEEDGLLPRRA